MPRGGGLKKMKIRWGKVKGKKIKDIFGTKPLNPPDSMKAMWAYIKKNKLVKKKDSKKKDDDCC